MTQPKTVQLFAEELGTGTPLVLVHGFPLDRTSWSEVAKLLAADARVVLPDLRGFGRSPVTEGVYSMELLAEDLAALLDRLSIDQAILAGHSMGGYVTLAFARAFPERLAGLALVTSHAIEDAPDRKESRNKLAEEVENRGVEAVIEATLARYSPYPEVLERTRALMLQANPRAVSAALRGMAIRPNLTGLLPSIHVPALVIGGEADELITLQRAQETARLLPQGELVMIPGGGHMVMWERPDLVADALRRLVWRVNRGDQLG